MNVDCRSFIKYGLIGAGGNLTVMKKRNTYEDIFAL